MTPDTPSDGYHAHRRYQPHNPTVRARRPSDRHGRADARTPLKIIIAIATIVVSSALFVFSYAAIGRTAQEGCQRDRAEAIVLADILERSRVANRQLHNQGIRDYEEYVIARDALKISIRKLEIPSC